MTAASSAESQVASSSCHYHLLRRGQRYAVDLRLVVPESDRNLALGMFQITAQALTSDLSPIPFASASFPATLRFHSSPLRLLRSLLLFLPALTGAAGEQQVLQLRLLRAKEGALPLCALRVTLEPRAGLPAGMGLPEVYDASLRVRSLLSGPAFLVLAWRGVVFLALAAIIFGCQAVALLVCCGPLVARWVWAEQGEGQGQGRGQGHGGGQAGTSRVMMEQAGARAQAMGGAGLRSKGMLLQAGRGPPITMARASASRQGGSEVGVPARGSAVGEGVAGSNAVASDLPGSRAGGRVQVGRRVEGAGGGDVCEGLEEPVFMAAMGGDKAGREQSGQTTPRVNGSTGDASGWRKEQEREMAEEDDAVDGLLASCKSVLRASSSLPPPAPHALSPSPLHRAALSTPSLHTPALPSDDDVSDSTDSLADVVSRLGASLGRASPVALGSAPAAPPSHVDSRSGKVGESDVWGHGLRRRPGASKRGRGEVKEEGVDVGGKVVGNGSSDEAARMRLAAVSAMSAGIGGRVGEGKQERHEAGGGMGRGENERGGDANMWVLAGAGAAEWEEERNREGGDEKA